MKLRLTQSRLRAQLSAMILTLLLCLSLLPAGASGVPELVVSAFTNGEVGGGVDQQARQLSKPFDVSLYKEFPVVAVYEPAARHAGDGADQQALYLSTFFDISLSKEFINMGAYTEALMKLQPSHGLPELACDNPQYGVGALDAVKYAVIGANMKELAMVYPTVKADAVLKDADTTGVDPAYAPYVACALDLGMITPAQARMVAVNSQADIAFTNSLLIAAAEVNGVARNYLGYSDDPDIYAKFINAFEAFTLFDDPVLSAIGSEAVMRQVTTGYSLKSDRYNARFLPELTLVYGHSSAKHAAQVIGLLRSEGVVAKVQFEPKVSIYQYLAEWGDPGEPTPTYAVKTVNENLMLAYATEYDMVLEFADQAGKEKIDALIVNYAKKNSGEEGKAILAGSWWQPLYYSRVEMGGDYHMLYDNIITNGSYSLHPFCLAEDKAEVMARFLAIDPAMDIVQEPIWCNAAFHRYLNGLSE